MLLAFACITSMRTQRSPGFDVQSMCWACVPSFPEWNFEHTMSLLHSEVPHFALSFTFSTLFIIVCNVDSLRPSACVISAVRSPLSYSPKTSILLQSWWPSSVLSSHCQPHHKMDAVQSWLQGLRLLQWHNALHYTHDAKMEGLGKLREDEGEREGRQTSQHLGVIANRFSCCSVWKFNCSVIHVFESRNSNRSWM